MFERRRGDQTDVSSFPSCPHCNSDHVVDRGSTGNGRSPAQQRHSAVSERLTPVPFIELIRHSTPVMFDARPTPTVNEMTNKQPTSVTSHTAGMAERPASLSADESCRDLKK